MGFYDKGDFILEFEDEAVKNEIEGLDLRTLQAWNRGDPGDIEYLLDSRSNLIEFGYRTKDLRDTRKVSRSDRKKITEQFFELFDSFEVVPQSGTVRQIENVIIVAAFFTEKMKLKDGQTLEANVRYTATLMKINDKWQQVLAHRDTQFG